MYFPKITRWLTIYTSSCGISLNRINDGPTNLKNYDFDDHDIADLYVKFCNVYDWNKKQTTST